MPVRSFLINNGTPEDPLYEQVPLDSAVEVFEEAGVMPAEAISLLVVQAKKDAAVPIETHAYMRPSHMNPSTTCRRETFIERFLPYDIDPLKQWAAMEGTLWARLCETDKTFLHEVDVPSTLLAEGPPYSPETLPTYVRLCEDQRYRVEVFPGVWLAGTIDRAPKTWRAIGDHKVNKYPWTFKKGGVPWGMKPDDMAKQANDWKIQLNIYGYIVEQVRGEPVEELYVWRKFAGSQNPQYTFRKILVPRIRKETLWREIGPHVESMLTMMAAGVEITKRHRAAGSDPEVELREYAKNIPMDGRDKQIFNGKKCLEFCGAADVCLVQLEASTLLSF